MKRNKAELPQELSYNKIGINYRHKREARCRINTSACKRVFVGAVAPSQHSALVQYLSSVQHAGNVCFHPDHSEHTILKHGDKPPGLCIPISKF